MENFEQDLPIEIWQLIGEDRVSLRWKNTACTYFIKAKNGQNQYLKIQPVGSVESLYRQAMRLLWLQDKLPVPEVNDYGTIGGQEYLLTKEIPGTEASNVFFKQRTEDMIQLISRGLRGIHDIPIEDCPFDNSIEQLMRIIWSNYDKGKINKSEDKSLYEVEKYAKNLKEDLVFTHGDYSLPNVIIHDGCISGYIDLGNCGVADRYYDLAVAEKSIIRNFGQQYVELFFAQYGIADIDYEKIRFYKLVERFVWA